MPPAASVEKTDTLRTLLLPEGVELELHPAGPLTRGQAWMIDLLWLMLWYLIAGIIIGLSASALGFGAAGLSLLLAFLLNWGYHIFYEGRTGATPGKRRMGLHVVTTEGAPIGWTAAFLRNVLRVADFLPAGYLIGLVSCMSTKRFQRLGDIVAGTVVVYRDPEPSRLPPRELLLSANPAPPPLALSREERSAVIHFAERASLWSPERQQELAAHLRPVTGTGGPEGVRRLLDMGVWLRDS